ncbi:MAG TPA: DUF4350 domain-containing protein [Candidatus Nanopelagicales bacterium]|jgi:hypothetical protein
MTTSAPTPAAGPTAVAALEEATATSSLDPTLRDRVRRNRLLVGTVLLVLVVVGLLAYAGNDRAAGYLDPAAVDPSGSRALANVLEGQGVQVVPVVGAQAAADALRSAGAGSTLLITDPGLLSPRMGQALSGVQVDHVVLVGSVPDTAGPWPGQDPTSDNLTVQVRDPACTWPPAVRAGGALTGGEQFAIAGAQSCYDGSVLDVPAGTDDLPGAVMGSVTLLGSGDALTNADLGSDGNAALATAVLGRDRVLVWWSPTIADPLFSAQAGERPTLDEVLPSWVPWVLVQLVIGVLVLAYARGRRFGPVVREPLPVTVRAAEAIEGLSRLYRRSQDRGHAADVLARASRRRLGHDLRLPSAATTADVVRAVAERTGRGPAEVLALLDPAVPPDDAALVRLADDLDSLERQVRRP